MHIGYAYTPVLLASVLAVSSLHLSTAENCKLHVPIVDALCKWKDTKTIMQLCNSHYLVL